MSPALSVGSRRLPGTSPSSATTKRVFKPFLPRLNIDRRRNQPIIRLLNQSQRTTVGDGKASSRSQEPLAARLQSLPNYKATPLQALGMRRPVPWKDDYEWPNSHTSIPTAKTKITLTNALLWKNARLIPARSRLAAARCS
jgi:hypothetical protein